MADISNQLIKDSFNYVLQSDLSTGVVYRIGGTIPVNPIFQSGLTVNSGFTYSNGTEQVGYALLTDGTGYAYWAPVSAATPSSGVTSVTAGSGLSGNVSTGAVTLVNTSPDQIVTISGGTGITTGGTYPNFTIVNSAPDRTVTITGGTNIQITGTYPDFGVNFTGLTTGGTVSGDYLPLSGGTVTGGTVFQSGITATTISASTYYNLPIDVFVTGGTYSGSNILFTNNTGGTFSVTGLTASGMSANYYGSFSDNTNQAVSGANIPTIWKYNTTELSNGIFVSGGTKIVVQNTGVYEIGYSPQIEKTQGPDARVTIWASINGNPVTRSSSTLGLVSNSTLQLPFVSLIFELNANDYVEFYFSSDNEHVQLTALSGLTTPTRPDSPSIIIVAKQIGTSVSVGSTGDTYVTGFTLSSNTITLSQNRTDQYSAFTISLSAYTGSTTGGTVSGDYLPLSGGTVTGGTLFQSGLTANTFYSSGQVGVGTSNPNSKAIIEIASTSQGVLFPRMTKVQRDAISSPPTGLILFVTDGDNEGLYIYKSTGWVQII